MPENMRQAVNYDSLRLNNPQPCIHHKDKVKHNHKTNRQQTAITLLKCLKALLQEDVSEYQTTDPKWQRDINVSKWCLDMLVCVSDR